MDALKEFADKYVEAEKLWRGADHLVYVTYPVVKDEKLLLKALEGVHRAAVIGISLALKIGYVHRRILSLGDPEKNLDMFFRKCVVFDDADEKTLRELLMLGKKHKESGFEFSRKGKAVIMDDDLGMKVLGVDQLKSFLRVCKVLLDSTNNALRGNF